MNKIGYDLKQAIQVKSARIAHNGWLERLTTHEEEFVQSFPPTYVQHQLSTKFHRKIVLPNSLNDEAIEIAKEQLAKDIYYEFYGELLGRLQQLNSAIEYGDREISQKLVNELLEDYKWEKIDE